jgi:hypothetical protein
MPASGATAKLGADPREVGSTGGRSYSRQMFARSQAKMTLACPWFPSSQRLPPACGRCRSGPQVHVRTRCRTPAGYAPSREVVLRGARVRTEFPGGDRARRHRRSRSNDRLIDVFPQSVSWGLQFGVTRVKYLAAVIHACLRIGTIPDHPLFAFILLVGRAGRNSLTRAVRRACGDAPFERGNRLLGIQV